MEIVFRNPFYLWALVFLPIILIAHFISVRYNRARAIKFTNFVALARVSQKVKLSSNLTVLYLRLLVFAAIVFAIAGTTVYYEGSQVDADYILAIDSSASMLAEDFEPNRFEAAKLAAINFVDELPIHSSVGLVSFSGTSFVRLPLTVDKNLAKKSIESLEVLTSGGTSIGDAIVASSNLLMNSAKPKVIILLTDGRSNLGIEKEIAIKYANQNNVIVNAIGIGSSREPIASGNQTFGSLGINEDELKDISSFTGGKYYHGSETNDLSSIYNEIAISKKSKASLDLSFFLLLFILITLLAEWILINTRFRIIP